MADSPNGRLGLVVLRTAEKVSRIAQDLARIRNRNTMAQTVLVAGIAREHAKSRIVVSFLKEMLHNFVVPECIVLSMAVGSNPARSTTNYHQGERQWKNNLIKSHFPRGNHSPAFGFCFVQRSSTCHLYFYLCGFVGGAVVDALVTKIPQSSLCFF